MLLERARASLNSLKGGTILLDEIGELPPGGQRNCCVCSRKASLIESVVAKLVKWMCG